MRGDRKDNVSDIPMGKPLPEGRRLLTMLKKEKRRRKEKEK